MEPGNSAHAARYMSIIDSYKSERWCDDCWLLKHLCICSHVSTLIPSVSLNFHLFIHYKEYKRTSNTGIILKKLLPTTGVYYSGLEADRQRLIKACENKPNTCVLYPGDKSIALETWVKGCSEGEKNFVLLDSTWNQGRKLLNSLPENFARVKIMTNANSLIKCKKQTNKGYLSTLECAAFILKELGEADAFESIMNAFVLKDKAALKQTNKHALLKNLEDNQHYELDKEIV